MSARRIGAVARVELLRLLRTRVAFSLLLLVPAFQLVLFGYAIRPVPHQLSVAVGGETPEDARRLAAAVAHTDGLVVVARAVGTDRAAFLVRRGVALVGLDAPVVRSLADPFATPRPLRVTVDASDAALTAGAAAAVETGYWRALAQRDGQTGPGFQVTRLFNPAARADWTFLPALVGAAVMIGTVMLGTLSLARERETGAWETMLALPLRPAEALVGKLLPYVLVGTVQGCLVLLAARLLFGLPATGSVVALIALLPLFAAAHVALGYALAARAPTQLTALQGAVAFYLPAMLLSGFLYPAQTLPGWARVVGAAFPLTHWIRAARGALLRGDGAAATLAHAGPIALFLTVVIAAALALQARRLDGS